PPGRGDFWFQIFIQAPPPEIWPEMISGGEKGPGAVSGGGLFWATSLERIFGGVIAIISRPGGWTSLPCRGVLSFLSEARGESDMEPARVHPPARRRGGRVAARGARAAGGDAVSGSSTFLETLATHSREDVGGRNCRQPAQLVTSLRRALGLARSPRICGQP